MAKLRLIRISRSHQIILYVENTCVTSYSLSPTLRKYSRNIDIFSGPGWTNQRKATCLSLPGCTVHCKRAGRQVCTPSSSVDLSMTLSRHPPPANPASPLTLHAQPTQHVGYIGIVQGPLVFKSALNTRIFCSVRECSRVSWRGGGRFVTSRFSRSPQTSDERPVLSFHNVLTIR